MTWLANVWTTVNLMWDVRHVPYFSCRRLSTLSILLLHGSLCLSCKGSSKNFESATGVEETAPSQDPTPELEERSCTELPCGPHLHMKFSPVSPSFLPLQIQLGWQEGNERKRCDATLHSDGNVTTTGNCPGISAMRDSGRIAGIWSDFAPDSVQVSVQRQGTELLKETFSPAYTINRPNGEDCPPACREGTITLELPK